MSNYRGPIQHRIGRQPRVEYVNRAGEPVNPHTGKPLQKSKFGNKPYARPVSKENGLVTVKHRKLPIKRTGALFGPLQPITTDPTIDPPPHVCFNCWQPGHKKTNCPRPLSNRFCNNCGRRNEDMRTCPRCRDAHKVWSETIKAKTHGEDIDEQLFLADIDDDVDIEDVNDPDEILQELIYQDQKTREHLEYQQRKKLERETRDTIYKNNTVLKEQGTFGNSRDKYIEQVTDPYITQKKTYVNERKPYNKPRGSYREEFIDRDPLIDGDLYTNEEESSSYHDKRQSTHQERHIGMAVFKEHEGYDQEVELEQNSAYQGYTGIPYRNREERVKTPEPPRIDNSWHKAVADASTVSSSSDPVQDILILAKTISHLSSETQDLIMRQVIAERQEQTRRREAAQERQDNPW